MQMACQSASNKSESEGVGSKNSIKKQKLSSGEKIFSLPQVVTDTLLPCKRAVIAQ